MQALSRDMFTTKRNVLEIYDAQEEQGSAVQD